MLTTGAATTAAWRRPERPGLRERAEERRRERRRRPLDGQRVRGRTDGSHADAALTGAGSTTPAAPPPGATYVCDDAHYVGPMDSVL